MAGVFDRFPEGLGKANGGQKGKIRIFGLPALLPVAVSIDGNDAVRIFCDYAAPLVKAEHPGHISISF